MGNYRKKVQEYKCLREAFGFAQNVDIWQGDYQEEMVSMPSKEEPWYQLMIAPTWVWRSRK